MPEETEEIINGNGWTLQAFTIERNWVGGGQSYKGTVRYAHKGNFYAQDLTDIQVHRLLEIIKNDVQYEQVVAGLAAIAGGK